MQNISQTSFELVAQRVAFMWAQAAVDRELQDNIMYSRYISLGERNIHSQMHSFKAVVKKGNFLTDLTSPGGKCLCN